ncbi:MAG: FkbM family methyltransferase [Gammaproteobacteria bacterium]|nr:FkbM family methyltransferase [Gammaproteobacteria bacterium]
MISRLKGVLRRAGLIDRDTFRGFLRDVSGVIHVGAHIGQERELYAQYGLKVLWIEPLTELFAALQSNLRGYPDQRALKYLITERDDADYSFNVASNAGGSSSILELNLHKDIWPDVELNRSVPMKSKTLASVLRIENIEASDYDALIMDTQGTELLVLRGAEPLLGNFRYIKTEVADFEAYKGCCLLADVEAYLEGHGFTEHARKTIARHPGGGGYYDVVYRARGAGA